MSTKTNGYSSKILHAKREKKHDDGLIRMAKHNGLTTQEKIAKAKSRPGENKRELTRLYARLEVEKAEKAALKATKQVDVKPKKSKAPVK